VNCLSAALAHGGHPQAHSSAAHYHRGRHDNRSPQRAAEPRRPQARAAAGAWRSDLPHAVPPCSLRFCVLETSFDQGNGGELPVTARTETGRYRRVGCTPFPPVPCRAASCSTRRPPTPCGALACFLSRRSSPLLSQTRLSENHSTHKRVSVSTPSSPVETSVWLSGCLPAPRPPRTFPSYHPSQNTSTPALTHHRPH
jgi:hypothetical protein